VDPHRAFRAEATTLLEDVFRRLGHEGGLPAFEVPPDPAMGDLGCPCFPLARPLRRAPSEIAREAAAAVDASGTTWVREVRAVGPYVNLFLDRNRLAAHVLRDPDAALTAAPKPGRVLLEHTSANPNGPLHVGRARNPILGDTLARLHRAAGHDTHVQYYMDNLGRQVALLYWGARNIPEDDLPPAGRDKPDHVLVRYYQAANERMKEDPVVAEEVRALVARLEAADPDLLADVRRVYEACFAGMRESLERLGCAYDSTKDESDLVASGAVEETLHRLQGTPRAAQEEDGAWYLDLSDVLKGQKDRFYVTRKDGTSVYATRDVAYHVWKAGQVGDDGRLVDVLGEDHRLQALQVRTALEALGERVPTVVFYAFVALPEGKMSTRVGRVVFLDELMDEAVARADEEVRRRRADLPESRALSIAEAVGIAAVRFNIVRIQPEKPIEFRWEEALDFEGDSAPYLMYAHARAASLLRKAAEEGLVPRFDAGHIGDGEARLAATVARFLPEAEEAVERLAPHRFAVFALELASAFNEYYRDHPVLQCEDEALRGVRLLVVQAAREALRRAHEALGLPVLDEM